MKIIQIDARLGDDDSPRIVSVRYPETSSHPRTFTIEVLSGAAAPITLTEETAGELVDFWTPHIRVDDVESEELRFEPPPTGFTRSEAGEIGLVIDGRKVDPAMIASRLKYSDAAEDLLETAWILIANASGGDWTRASSEWRAAAEKWRDRYHGPKVTDRGSGDGS